MYEAILCRHCGSDIQIPDATTSGAESVTLGRTTGQVQTVETSDTAVPVSVASADTRVVSSEAHVVSTEARVAATEINPKASKNELLEQGESSESVVGDPDTISDARGSSDEGISSTESLDAVELSEPEDSDKELTLRDERALANRSESSEIEKVAESVGLVTVSSDDSGGGKVADALTSSQGIVAMVGFGVAIALLGLFVGILGTIAGLTISAFGLFMHIVDKGWWERLSSRFSGDEAIDQDTERVGLVDRLTDYYEPLRIRFGDSGVIFFGLITVAMSFFVDFAGTVSGLSMAVVGIFILGVSRGWWNDISLTPDMERLGSETSVATELSQNGLPVRATVSFALLPAILLIISCLPIVPWTVAPGRLIDWINSVGGLEGSLLDLILNLHEADIWWYEGVVSYTLAIVGSVLNWLICLSFVRGPKNQYRTAPGPMTAAKNSLDRFLVISILFSALSCVAVLHAWWFFTRLILNGDNTLGAYLCIFTALSLMVYIVFLVANRRSNDRFNEFDIGSLFTIGGRMTRPTFVLMVLPMTLMVTGVVLISLLGRDTSITGNLSDWISGPLTGPMSTIFVIGAIWMYLIACVKRFHDRDMAAWWVLSVIIAQLIATFLVIFSSRWILGMLDLGEDLTAMLLAEMFVAMVILLVNFAAIFELLFTSGSESENRYGAPQ